MADGLSLAQGGLWRVAARFRQGLLLCGSGGTIFVGTEEASPGPYHLLLPAPDFQCLNEWSEGMIIRSRGGYLERGGIQLRSDRASRYRTNLPPLDLSAARWAEEGLTAFLLAANRPTGFGPDARTMINDEPGIFKPESLANDLSLRELLSWLIGRGSGLTPAGDDFIVGLMAALPHRADLYAQVAELLSRDPGLTGLVSRAYYQAALAGRFDHHLNRLAEAEAKRDKAMFQMYLEKIQNHGHSSGTDLLCGLRLALKARVVAAL